MREKRQSVRRVLNRLQLSLGFPIRRKGAGFAWRQSSGDAVDAAGVPVHAGVARRGGERVVCAGARRHCADRFSDHAAGCAQSFARGGDGSRRAKQVNEYFLRQQLGTATGTFVMN